MRLAALTTLLLGALLRVAAQTTDPSQVAAIIAQLEDTPAIAAKFNLFKGREVWFLVVTDHGTMLTWHFFSVRFRLQRWSGRCWRIWRKPHNCRHKRLPLPLRKGYGSRRWQDGVRLPISYLFLTDLTIFDVNRPCGLATPHYHPRAAEFLYMLTGTNIRAGFLLENGIRLVENDLSPNQAMLFPKNSFHYQANLGCDPVTFVAGWNHEDPGAATVAQRCK